jgi:hypothetical protein
MIEDTPQGVTIETRYQSSGCQDALLESISMNMLANICQYIKKMESTGGVRVTSLANKLPH